MRIDNPISDNAIITGSFTGSFKGDGSQLTGIEHPSIPAGVVSGSGQIVLSDTVGYSALDGRVTSVEGDVSAILAASSADKDSFAEIVTLINSVDTTNDDALAAYVLSNNTAVGANTSKLAGIEAGATGDQSAAEILTALKTVDGAGSGLDADLLDGQSSAYYATATAVAANTQALADLDLTYASDADVTAVANDVATNAADIATNVTAIAANTTKLAGIEAGATGDQTAAEILTALKTVDGSGSGLDADLLDGQSSAYYATATSVATNTTKLAGIESGATGDQTGAEIKALYEGEADTNAFTDAASAKLAGIEAGATGDQSAAEILTAIKTVDGAGSGLDADLLDGQSSAYYATAASVSTNSTNIAANTAAIATKATPADVTTAVNNLINGAGTAYDTLSELGAAITANDSDIATILTTQSGKLSKASNLSDLTDAAAARTNLGLGTAATTAATAYATAAQGALAATAHGWGNHASAGYLTSYTDTNTTYSAGSGITLTGTTFSLTTPITNNNQLTNGAGYITSYVNTTYSAGTGVTLTGTTFSIGQAVATTSNVTFGSVTASGNITAYSDARLKKDVKTIEGALAKTNSLRGVEYTRIADDAKSIGVIAQELEAVLPELVATDDEGMKSVNYAQITGLLIEAVKELSAKVDELSK